jgi:protein phosphatase 4 regulatory subunit 3
MSQILCELFNMARMSLQQHEKDDFVETTVTMMIPLNDNVDGDDDANNVRNNDEGGARQQCNNVNLLSPLILTLRFDIIGMIAMHDPSPIQKYCLNYVDYETELKKAAASGASAITNSINMNDIQPDPNNAKEVLFSSPPDDLLLSLIFVMGTETDAGLLLQTSEIIRIILDTEMMGEQQQEGQSLPDGSFLEEENDFNAANTNTSNGNGENEGNSNIQMAGSQHCHQIR